ncbi:MAG: threonine--tRNA ligase, partial [Spirochaetaceae bacterium]|nr:threonine--tRNA ligase [Spirochaetaceae bacterium]
AFNDYAQQVAATLEDGGFRVQADLGNDRMNAKIRLAQTQKIPYMLVVGEKEEADQAVAVRFRDGRQQQVMKLADFAAYLQENVSKHSVEL